MVSLSGAHKTVQVKCAICGDTSHPTRDCAQRQRQGGQGGDGGGNKEVLDKEYLNFMQELGEVRPHTGQTPPLHGINHQSTHPSMHYCLPAD